MCFLGQVMIAEPLMVVRIQREHLQMGTCASKQKLIDRDLQREELMLPGTNEARV